MAQFKTKIFVTSLLTGFSLLLDSFYKLREALQLTVFSFTFEWNVEHLTLYFIYFKSSIVYILPHRGQDASREHSYPVQPCSHSDHRPGSEHPRRGGTSSTRAQTSSSENEAPGRPGGSEQACLGSLRVAVGFSRSTVLPNPRDGHLGKYTPPYWCPAPSGSTEDHGKIVGWWLW